MWTFRTGGAIFSRPLVHGDHIYILSDDGILYKMGKNTGTFDWTFDTGGNDWSRKLPIDENPGWDTVVSGVTISDNTIYAGSAVGHLFAIDAASGTEKWRFKTNQ